MIYPPPILLFVSKFNYENFLNVLNTDFLCILSVLLPFVFMPIVLPMVVLMANRKRLMDNPDARKTQKRPVAVMGGTVIMLVICITSIILNLFYNISNLFPAMCVMMILYIFGMLDDNIGLSWQFKLGMQIFVILLLFFGGNYGINSLYGMFGIYSMPMWCACLLTVFTGLLLLNAVNFADGIDGLASGLGVLASLAMGYWNLRHGFVTQALQSFTVVGVMASFFLYNVFSKRYKMYMGDSGSLVLGLFLFLSICQDPYYLADDAFIVDSYFLSFIIALFSAMLFDSVRVVIMRALKGNSPFEPDRSHLHHAYVDAGMSHLLATIKIILNNMAVIMVWYFTAKAELSEVLQLAIVLSVGVVFIWVPYFMLEYLKNKSVDRYILITRRCRRRSEVLNNFSNLIQRLVDGRRRQTHIAK